MNSLEGLQNDQFGFTFESGELTYESHQKKFNKLFYLLSKI